MLETVLQQQQTVTQKVAQKAGGVSIVSLFSPVLPEAKMFPMTLISVMKSEAALVDWPNTHKSTALLFSTHPI